MPLSSELSEEHEQAWVENLDQPYYPYRKFWPKFLFHHAPLENALSIIKDDALRARNDENLLIARDVAAQDVLNNREIAHDFVRFYFRPGTPTQYHIEGIRKQGECAFGDSAHCPFLIMFVFDAKSLLTAPGTNFSDGNMQSNSTKMGNDDEFFKTIDFAKVFNVGPCDREVIRSRCAEVLAQSPVAPSQSLKSIIFRSNPERDTFLHLLGDDAEKWGQHCFVSDALKTFEKRFSFIDHLSLENSGVGFRANQRHDHADVSFHITISNWTTGQVLSEQVYHAMPSRPEDPSKVWKWSTTVPDGDWLLKVAIDGHLAYCNKHQLGNVLF